MTYSEMREAVKSAESTIEIAEWASHNIAVILKGRLRNVRSQSVLAALKRELRDYNIHTGQWKEAK